MYQRGREDPVEGPRRIDGHRLRRQDNEHERDDFEEDLKEEEVDEKEPNTRQQQSLSNLMQVGYFF